MPCSPNDISIDIPEGPSGPSIPGLGTPFSLNVPSDILPDGFPENLLELLDLLNLLLPSGSLLPQLSTNFGKDIFDAILSLLDKFMPFLLFYKFFLPILNLLLCIMEVLCAIPNPFKVTAALVKLFRQCLPDFLNLFPIFALIIMLISLILLLLALIEYIILQILKLIELILRNLLALERALTMADPAAILAIAKKLGASLCIFQNLFVLLAIFNIIFQIIKDILSKIFAIPPCDDDDVEGCCSPDVCPSIVKNGDYTRATGTINYLSEAGVSNILPGLPDNLPAEFASLNILIREESWQLFDDNQSIQEEFKNIYDAFDVGNVPIPGLDGVSVNIQGFGSLTKPIFYPVDAIYNDRTPARQAPYTVDVKFLYNPSLFGRTGVTREVIFKDCIVIRVPSPLLSSFSNFPFPKPKGVLRIAGGTGFEADGETPLKGFDEDKITELDIPASLNNFISKPKLNTSSPNLSPTDLMVFENVEYTFKPNRPVLVGKNLVTSGCLEDVSLTKTFINQAFAGDFGVKLTEVRELIDSPTFPNPQKTQDCLQDSVNKLRLNLTALGVAEFQSKTLECLEDLRSHCNSSLVSLVKSGFEPCNSVASIDNKVQFTTKPIKVSLLVKERNNTTLTSNLPLQVGNELAKEVKGIVTLGNCSEFEYDGEAFVADLTSSEPGQGKLSISFNNNILCTNNIPEDIDDDLSRDIQEIDYEFIYAPVGPTVVGGDSTSSSTGPGDTDGKPRRDDSDISKV